MAARINKPLHDEKTKSDWRFYVYDILDCEGNPIYVGKGSGCRRKVSERYRGGASSIEAARFFDEEDAYRYEIERIADINPMLNKHIGGNGARCSVVKTKKIKIDAQTRLMNKIGTRAYAARMLLSYYNAYKYLESKVDRKNEILKKCYTEEIKQLFNTFNVAKLTEVAYG